MTKQKEELEHRLKLRNIKLTDYDDIRDIMVSVYKDVGGAWTKEELKNQLRVFTEGQICSEDNGKVIAVALSIVVAYIKVDVNHRYDEITGYGKFDTHDE